MKKIGITGQGGFIGSHLYNYLNLDENIELINFQREFFESPTKLNQFVTDCNVIVHLAALNRHEKSQFIYDINIGLVEKLINACIESNSKPHIIFSSSTQIEKDNLYGKSKLIGGEIIKKWAIEKDAKYSNLIIPNVFGPFGKPFYNSVVATFCHQVVNNEKPTIINDGTLNLIYVNELIADIKNVILEEKTGLINISHRHTIKVSQLLEILNSFYKKYISQGEFPSIDNAFNLALFNTFRCYIPHDHYPKPFIKHTDNRGYFVEIVRANTSGQFSFSTTKPGITRGNHFHTRKAERFAVIKGKAKISLRKINTTEVIDYLIDGNSPAFVDMPIWHTHNITNVGNEEMIALFWINEPYDSENPDTYYINV